MAALAAKAEIFLGINVKGLKQGFKQGVVYAKSFQEQLEKHRATFRKTAIVSGAMFGAQLLWLNRVTEAAGRQEAAETKLRDALKNVAGTRKEDVDALIEQAAQLQKVTKYGDEQTISAQAQLATFQLTAKQIRAITPRMLDMVAAQEKLTGAAVDQNSIAIALGKAFTGQIGLLSRYGVQLTETEKKTLSYETLLEALDKRFKGIAEGSAKTFLGRKRQLANVIGDLNEKFGFVFLPMLTDLAQKMIPVVEKVADWVDRNKRLVMILTGAGIGGAGLIFGLSTMGYLLAGLPALFAAVTGPIGWLIAGVVALTGAIVALSLKHGQHKTALQKFNEEQRRTKTEIESLTSKIQTHAIEKAELIRKADELRQKVKDERDEFGPYHRLLADVEQKLKDNARETANLTEEKRKLIGVQGEVNEQMAIEAMLEQNKQRYIELQAELEKYEQKMAKAGEGVGQLSGFHSDLARTGLEKTKRALQENKLELAELTQALEDLRTKGKIEMPSIEAPTATYQQTIEEITKRGKEALETDIERKEATEELNRVLADLSVIQSTDIPASFDIVKDKIDEVDERMGESAKEWELWTGVIGEAIERNIGGTFMDTLEYVQRGEKNLLRQTVITFGLATLQIVRMAIQQGLAELMTTKVIEVGKAAIRGVLTPWTLLQIPVIGAVAAAAISGLRALETKIYKPEAPSFQEGIIKGPIPFTGIYELHRGELVFNPRINTREQLATAIGGTGGRGDQFFVSPSFYGPIDSKLDIDKVALELAKRIKKTRWG